MTHKNWASQILSVVVLELKRNKFQVQWIYYEISLVIPLKESAHFKGHLHIHPLNSSYKTESTNLPATLCNVNKYF